MTGPTLSPEQQRAVEHPATDACVVAGAGSGKTRVLTERFVRLVQEGGLSARRLPALTFTEKAASEMRRRIRTRFLEAGRDQDALDVEFAPIQTLHSYCATLLRTHAIEAGLDPAFRVLEAGEAALLLDESADLAGRWLHAHEPQHLLALRHLESGLPRAALLLVLEALHGSGLGAEAVHWRHGPGALDALHAEAEAALDAWHAVAGTHVKDADRPDVEAAVAAGREALAMTPQDDAADAFACFPVATAVKTASRARKQPYPEVRTAATEAFKALGARRLDHFGATVLAAPLRAVLRAYEVHYERAKRERWALDFTDLERRAVALLEDLAARGRRPDFAPQALLVDEYQDTNPLQARLLALLRAFGPQFAVGDPKQSIYRFRRADVRVLMAERARVGTDGQHLLQDSYRAVPELVDVINGLHERLFADGAAGVPYEPLRAAGTFAPSREPVCELALIRAEDNTPIEQARVLEARWIAARIRALVDARIPKRRDPQGAPIEYGDIAILMRARASLDVYESALDQAGIPFLTLKGRGYFLAEELRDLAYVLRVVHNPADEYALACTLTGPAFGADEDDLARWFGYEGERAWDRLCIEAQGGGRFARHVRVLAAMQREAVHGQLSDVVAGALHDLGLLEVALLLPSGARRAANLRKAIDVARGLERQGRLGLDDFLWHLARMRERETPEPFAPVGGDGANVVRLTTVHGAKGLEYPVVFLADAGRTPGADHSSPIRVDADGGLACRMRDPLEGVKRHAAGFAQKVRHDTEAEAQESLRLLYVATTRAEERLVISAPMTGVTQKGAPKGVAGWGRALVQVLDAPLDVGAHDLAVPGTRAAISYAVVDGTSLDVPQRRAPIASPPADGAARARALQARLDEDLAPLGGTRFVVSVSDVLTFADAPRRYYERCLTGTSEPAPPAHAADDLGDPLAATDAAWDVARTLRRARWDEAEEGDARGDPAAEGSALHGFVERWAPDLDDAALVDAALAVEFPQGVPPASHTRVHEMAARFRRCARGRDLLAALAAGGDVRRELALHARITFPGGARVGGYPALLVNGTIDLWLPTDAGIVVLDHKTNRKSARFPTPESVAAHYAWQLRLYALMAERLLGDDVAGAALLLVDPSWGPEAIEVPIDIGGPALVETRRLCQALAVAELEGRFPEDWRDLVVASADA